jgi:hypothetical protein
VVLKTHKEKRQEIKKPVVSDKKIIEKKQEVEPEEKEFWLRHPDYEIVKGMKYSLDGKSLDINNEGCIVVFDTLTKDRLISQGFHYLGYKIDDLIY